MMASWKRTVAAIALGVALSMAAPLTGQAGEELTPGLQAQIAAAVQSDDEAQVSEAIRSLVAANPSLAAQIAGAAARIRPDLRAVIEAAAKAAAPEAAPAIAAAVWPGCPLEVREFGCVLIREILSGTIENPSITSRTGL